MEENVRTREPGFEIVFSSLSATQGGDRRWPARGRWPAVARGVEAPREKVGRRLAVSELFTPGIYDSREREAVVGTCNYLPGVPRPNS